jgi:ribonuclease J
MLSPLRIVPLGGLGEVGMNCLALELDGSILVIDCGVTFPDHEPGVDIIHPDFAYLLERKEQIKAVVITHGHEDHIGALPYLLADVDVPVYGPRYALALVRERLSEFELPHEPRLIELKARERLQLGAFEVEPFSVTHSIPDSTGLVLRTRIGTLVHSGDFKIDPAPTDGQHFDLDFMRSCGDAGVRVLFSDSTNVDVSGVSGGEAEVAGALERQIRQAEQRVVVSMFGSNVQRLAAVLRVARELHRHVLLLGRSLQTHARIAEKLGLLPRPLPIYVSSDLAQTLPRNKLLVIASGSQGEPKAALARLAARTHHHLKLDEGDTLILSARTIPGHERVVHSLVDDFERQGVHVLRRHDDPSLHVSGHACREEQMQLISLVRPETFVPVHGTFHHLRRHAALARECGIHDTPVIENGAVLEVDATSSRVTGQTTVGRIHVQGGTELPDIVLRDRSLLSEVGIVMVTLNIDEDGALRTPPRVLTRGVIWEDEEAPLLADVVREVERCVGEVGLRASDQALQDAACRAVRRLFRDELGFRPLAHCVVTGRRT